jgi:hypothetical protein
MIFIINCLRLRYLYGKSVLLILLRMKKNLFLLSFLWLTLQTIGAQTPVKAQIHLKDGKTIDVHHFGKLKCESNTYAATYTTLRGKYNGIPTEISDYHEISKLILSGFTTPPVASVGNQKGSITVIKKSGVSVPLQDAELVMSCYGPSDKYNELHVQIINPLTDKLVDLTVQMNKIESITF